MNMKRPRLSLSALINFLNNIVLVKGIKEFIKLITSFFCGNFFTPKNSEFSTACAFVNKQMQISCSLYPEAIALHHFLLT